MKTIILPQGLLAEPSGPYTVGIRDYCVAQGLPTSEPMTAIVQDGKVIDVVMHDENQERDL